MRRTSWIHRSGTKTAGLGLVFSLLLALLAVVYHQGEAFNPAVLLITLAYCILHSMQDRANRELWLANPMRIALVAWLTLQLLHWARCFFAVNSWGLLGFGYEIIGYSPPSASGGCSQYLLLHYPYFLFMHFGYCSVFRIRRTHLRVKLDQFRVLFLAVPLLAVALGGFLVRYGGQLETPLVISYAVTNAGRLTYFGWMLITMVAIFPAAPSYRRVAWCVFLAGLLVGLWGVKSTGMRFLVLDQLVAAAVVWFSRTRLSLRTVIVAATFGIVGLGAFAAVTDLKNTGEALPFTWQRVPKVVDELVARGAAFHADVIARESEIAQGVFVEKREQVIRELLAGVPFSGFLTRQIGVRAVSVDMAFRWVVARQPVESSFFVPGLTTLRYTFGFAFAVVGAAVIGWVHGWVAKALVQPELPEGWVVQQGVMVPICLSGLGKSDLLRSVVDLFLSWLLIGMCSRPLGARGSPRTFNVARARTMTLSNGCTTT